MKKLILAAVVFSASLFSAHAETKPIAAAATATNTPCGSANGTNYVCIDANLIKDASGALMSSGTAYITPVDNNGNPIGMVSLGGGQVISGKTLTASVSGGQLDVFLQDAFTSGGTPRVCYNFAIMDNSTGQYVLGHDPAGVPLNNGGGTGTPGYTCVQPSINSTTQDYWCTSSNTICNFDYYNPTSVAVSPVSPSATVGLDNLSAAFTGDGGLIYTNAKGAVTEDGNVSTDGNGDLSANSVFAPTGSFSAPITGSITAPVSSATSICVPGPVFHMFNANAVEYMYVPGMPGYPSSNGSNAGSGGTVGGATLGGGTVTSGSTGAISSACGTNAASKMSVTVPSVTIIADAAWSTVTTGTTTGKFCNAITAHVTTPATFYSAVNEGGCWFISPVSLGATVGLNNLSSSFTGDGGMVYTNAQGQVTEDGNTALDGKGNGTFNSVAISAPITSPVVGSVVASASNVCTNLPVFHMGGTNAINNFYVPGIPGYSTTSCGTVPAGAPSAPLVLPVSIIADAQWTVTPSVSITSNPGAFCNALISQIGVVYTATNDGSCWHIQAATAGPQGNPGATGATGATGSQGIQGIQGLTGSANTLAIGTVTTLSAGSNATATITGAAPNQTLNIGIPTGNTGAAGASGGSAPDVVAASQQSGSTPILSAFAAAVGTYKRVLADARTTDTTFVQPSWSSTCAGAMPINTYTTSAIPQPCGFPYANPFTDDRDCATNSYALNTVSREYLSRVGGLANLALPVNAPGYGGAGAELHTYQDTDFGVTALNGFVHSYTRFKGGWNRNTFGYSAKTTPVGDEAIYTDFSRGQRIGRSFEMSCYGQGDCMMENVRMFSASGCQVASDECNHYGDKLWAQLPYVFTGTLPSSTVTAPNSGTTVAAPSTGATQLYVSATGGGGTQGEGRLLLDLSKASCGGESGTTAPTSSNYFECSGNHITGTSFITLSLPSNMVSPPHGYWQQYTAPAGAFPASTATATLGGQCAITAGTTTSGVETFTCTSPVNLAPQTGSYINLVGNANSYGVISSVSGSGPYTVTVTFSPGPAGSVYYNVATGTAYYGNVMNSTTSFVPGSQALNLAVNNGTFSSGIACIADAYFEQFPLTVSGSGSSTTYSGTFYYPHQAGAVISQGGSCGLAISLNADQVNSGANFNQAFYGLRLPIPIAETSTDGTTALLWMSGGGNSSPRNVNAPGQPGRTSGWAYGQVTATSVSYNATTGLVTVVCNSCGFAQNTSSLMQNGTPITLINLADISGQQLAMVDGSDTSSPQFNGSYTVVVTAPNTFQYCAGTGTVAACMPSGSNSSLTAPTGTVTATYCNCSFTLYPFAETLGVYDTANKSVDGLFQLGANNVNWAALDIVEQSQVFSFLWGTHNYETLISPTNGASPYALFATGTVTGTFDFFNFQNLSPVSNYVGYGGAYSLPYRQGYFAGPTYDTIQVNNAPEDAVIAVNGCKPGAVVDGVTKGGCSAYNADYDLIKAAVGTNFAHFHFFPQTDTFMFGDLSYANTVALGPAAVTALASGSTVGTCITLPCDGVTLKGTTATVNAPNAAFNAASIGTLNVGSCVGCGGGSTPGGSSGQVQVNSGGTSLTGYSGLTETSNSVGIGGSGYTMTGSGTWNVNTSGSGNTVIGNTTAGNTTVAGEYMTLSSQGGTTINGPVNFVNGATMSTTPATSSNTFNSSNPFYLNASVYQGSSTCPIGPTWQTYMSSASSGAVQFSGGGQSCGGVSIPLFAQFASGMYTYMSLPSHIITTNIAANGGTGSAPTLTNGSNVTASWTSGTTHTDMNGSVTLTLTGSVSAGAQLDTVYFGATWNTGAPNCVFSPANAATVGQLYIPPAATTYFTLNAATAITSNPTLVLTYACSK